MIALVGKGLLYVITACALIGVGSQIIQGPNGGGSTQTGQYNAPAPEITGPPVRPHCDYLQYMESRDSTRWEVWCQKPARPWDTVLVVRPDP